MSGLWKFRVQFSNGDDDHGPASEHEFLAVAVERAFRARQAEYDKLIIETHGGANRIEFPAAGLTAESVIDTIEKALGKPDDAE